MAVFTEVSEAEAQAFLDPLQVGRLLSLRGISAGIENTNYFVNTDGGQWVLTVFERLSFEQLPFYLRLMEHLAQRGIPVPRPRADGNGEILFSLKGKPAALVDKLEGGHQLAPGEHHCRQVGAMLARMHLQGRDFPIVQPNLRGLPWWTQTVPLVLPHMPTEAAALLQDELAFQEHLATTAAYRELPRGPIHADLFRDNVMFDGPQGEERLTGFFDFYFAGVDTFLFDLSVCLNDWCIDLDTGALVLPRAQAFVQAYESVRPLSSTEHRLLPALMRAGALRFWVSRLWDFHLPREAKMLKAHDPAHFERVLRARRADPWHAMAAASGQDPRP